VRPDGFLLERQSIEVVVRQRREGILLRASFQVYNDASDVKTLIDALAVEL
jgi:selenocysteine lyase/cysteine desulfurase